MMTTTTRRQPGPAESTADGEYQHPVVGDAAGERWHAGDADGDGQRSGRLDRVV